MISADNIPLNSESSDGDFTEDNYRRLLALAKQNYTFASYAAIPWGKRFVLWRHDCDYSLNRAHALAQLEASEGVIATYFLNPHCEYYNLFEKGQYRIVREILDMGHEIGLHFDASFHGAFNDRLLSGFIRDEADLLERLYGVRPAAFSFHNPVASDLTREAETYSGVVNCYSRRFKTEVSYCSDSNGYWRFLRLEEVLSIANDPCLQILTHPGWWQQTVMPPRRRIFRSIHGRAMATMRSYDEHLSGQGRTNLSGPESALNFLRKVDGEKFELLDILWNRGEVSTLYLELWRLLERQLARHCIDQLQANFLFSADEAKAFIQKSPSLSMGRKFEWIFQCSMTEIIGESSRSYEKWRRIYERTLKSADEDIVEDIEAGCIFVCKVVAELYNWSANTLDDARRKPWAVGDRSDSSLEKGYAKTKNRFLRQIADISSSRLN